jgi:hypothetical protein
MKRQLLLFVLVLMTAGVWAVARLEIEVGLLKDVTGMMGHLGTSDIVRATCHQDQHGA